MSLPIHRHSSRRAPALQPLAGDLALQRGRVHELCGPSRLILAARIMAKCQGPVVWIRPGWVAERLNAAGLFHRLGTGIIVVQVSHGAPLSSLYP